jgi:splicing factor 1
MEWYKERQASPEPVYDSAGKRVNTKEQRAKEKLMEERQVLVEIGMAITPSFKPPSDYSPAQMMKQKKLYIPVDKYPDFNFFGLIIGPRGNSQKRMEQETGCKIIIRGKGSVIEGKAKREFKGFNSADDDRMHVLISAETEQQLEKGVKMIQELLTPFGDEANRIKQMQLTELAKINGTWRENGVYEETVRAKANIRCEVCGDASHPTVDCTYKGVPLPPARREALASEYDKFLSEISGLDGKADLYEDYLASVVDTSAQIAVAPWMQR